MNPLEHLTSNVYGDSVRIELDPEINENLTDEFCDVTASKQLDFSLGDAVNTLLI